MESQRFRDRQNKQNINGVQITQNQIAQKQMNGHNQQNPDKEEKEFFKKKLQNKTLTNSKPQQFAVGDKTFIDEQLEESFLSREVNNNQFSEYKIEYKPLSRQKPRDSNRESKVLRNSNKIDQQQIQNKVKIIHRDIVRKNNNIELRDKKNPLMELVTQVPSVKQEDQEELNKTMTILLAGDNQCPHMDLTQMNITGQDTNTNQAYGGSSHLTQSPVNNFNSSSSHFLLNESIPEEPQILERFQQFQKPQQLYPSQQLKEASILYQKILQIDNMYDMIPVIYDQNNNVIKKKRFKKFTYYLSQLTIAANFQHLNDNITFLYKDHFLTSFQALEFYFQYQQLIGSQSLNISSKFINIPPQQLSYNDQVKKTLIFDLDETLIHCNESLNTPGDVIIEIPLKPGEIIKASINIRPYAKQILQNLSKHFEIVIFTASQGIYANKVIDHLDPEKKFVKYRIFRENCIQISTMFVKNNYQDQELMYLEQFLLQIKEVPDIRTALQQAFKYDSYKNFKSAANLLSQLYSSN